MNEEVVGRSTLQQLQSKTALKLSMLTHEQSAQIGQKLKVMDGYNPTGAEAGFYFSMAKEH